MFNLLLENGESMQILHYELGEKYEPHFDYFHDQTNQQLGGHRVATVLMYLSNVQKGGETIFPNSEVTISLIATLQKISLMSTFIIIFRVSYLSWRMIPGQIVQKMVMQVSHITPLLIRIIFALHVDLDSSS